MAAHATGQPMDRTDAIVALRERGLSTRCIAAVLLAHHGAALPLPRNPADWWTSAQIEAAERAAAARVAEMPEWANCLAAAVSHQDHKTLGYNSWQEYVFGEALMRYFPPRPRTKPEIDTRSVYFIQAITGGLVKIGVADDPEGRLAQIQRMSPAPLRIVALLPGVGQPGEAALHLRFATQRQHGEWFSLTSQQVREVTA